ncbi:MAG: BON domain-containing protein [Verrucomicrobiales bacterium]
MRTIKPLLGAALLLSVVACSDTGTEHYTSARKEQNTNNWGPGTDIQTQNTAVEGNQTSMGSASRIESQTQGSNLETNLQQASKSLEDTPDNELAERIKVAISTGSLGTTGIIAADQLTSIQVQAKDGVVTLTGKVGSEKERETMIKRVKGLEGVKDVVANLTIDPAAKDEKFNPRGIGAEQRD